MIADTYHERCEAAYKDTLEALATAGLRASFIDTGGDCKAIVVTGVDDRDFAEDIHMLLTANGGSLDDTRTAEAWEIGLYYPVEDIGTEEAMLMLLAPREPKDRPADDALLAEKLVRVARMLR